MIRGYGFGMRKVNGYRVFLAIATATARHSMDGMGWDGCGGGIPAMRRIHWMLHLESIGSDGVLPRIFSSFRGASGRKYLGLYPRVPVQGSRMCTITLTISRNKASKVSLARQ